MNLLPRINACLWQYVRVDVVLTPQRKIRETLHPQDTVAPQETQLPQDTATRVVRTPSITQDAR